MIYITEKSTNSIKSLIADWHGLTDLKIDHLRLYLRSKCVLVYVGK